MKGSLLCTLFLLITSFSVAACPGLGGWQIVPVRDADKKIDEDGNLISLYAYRRWPPYYPNYYLAPQVVVLNGGAGTVDCDNTAYWNIGSTASYYGRQAITLDLNYWANGRNTIKAAADYVVATLNKLVKDGYLSPTFYLMGGSAGTAVISAALDYHPSFVNRVERAIFVSGPFTALRRAEITNPNITGLMDANLITRLDSLNYGLPYKPNRYNQWIKPLLDKKGLRFFVAQDDDVFCEPYTCAAGTMYQEFLSWLSVATAATEGRSSYERQGALWVYPQGGHDLFNTHPELLHNAFGQ